MDARQFGSIVGGGSRRKGEDRASRRATLRVEGLETRQLLSGMITDVARLPEGLRVGPMAVNQDGALWFVERPADGTGAQQINRLMPGGSRKEFALPSDLADRTIGALAPDGKGSMWFTTAAPSADGGPLGGLGKVDAKGTFTQFALTSPGDRPVSAVAAPDGGLWVSVANAADGASLVKVAPDGGLLEFPVKDATALTWLTLDKAGHVWFVDGQKIGTMDDQGEVKRFDLPAPEDGSPIDLSNAHLTTASDGNVWFLGLGGLNRINAAGEVTSFPAPTTTLTSLSTAADGNLWFSFLPPTSGQYSDSPGTMVARMTPDGRTTVLPDRVDDVGAPVLRMAYGNDGGVWFDEGGTVVSRLSLSSVPTFVPPIVRPTTRSFFTVESGKPVEGTIVSFVPNTTGQTTGNYAVTIDWGDGTVEPGTVARNASGGFDVTGRHVYISEPDTWKDIRVTVTDATGGTSVIFNRAHVVAPSADPAPTPTPTPAPTPAPGPASGPWRQFPGRAVRPNAPAPAPTPTPTPVPTTPGTPTPAGTTNPTTPGVGSTPAGTTPARPTPTPAPAPTPTPTPARSNHTTAPAADPWSAYRRPGLVSETITAGRMPRTPRAGISTSARRPTLGLPTPRGPLARLAPTRPGMQAPRRF